MGANEPHHDIDLLIELKELYDKLKRIPRAKDLNKAHEEGYAASYSTYCHHFGSFQNAVQKMRKKFNIPESETDSEEPTLF